MARPLRVEFFGGGCHVVNRGNFRLRVLEAVAHPYRGDRGQGRRKKHIG